MPRSERTVEARILDRLSDVRRAAAESPAFAEWVASLPLLEVDGETLYVRGGDMLRDKDQLIFEWARRQGLLTDDAIARALAAGQP